MKKIIITGIVFIAFVLSILLFKFGNNNSVPQQVIQTDSVSNDFSRVPTGGQLLSNMKNAGLDPLSSEGTAMHIHQHLDIIINGSPVPVPADIGVGSGFISALHTHDTSGVIHVESPEQKDFTLSQFFEEWNVAFDDNHIGNLSPDQDHKLIIAINGTPITNSSNYVLKAHDEIEIWYGKKSELVSLIKQYQFGEGL